MPDTPKPVVADTKPIIMELTPGTYFFCTCGRSSKQPFCDGSHSASGFSPKAFEVKEAMPKAALCTCKHTSNAPFCDGTHKNVTKD